MKWKLTVIFFLLMAVTPLFVHGATEAELQRQIDEVRKDRETLLEEQRKLQAELDVLNKQSQTLGTAVKSLDATKKKLEADIKVTRSRINSATLNIKSLENTITEKEILYLKWQNLYET